MGIWVDYMEWVRNRPGMYIGCTTATALYYHLTGFGEALQYAGKADPEYESFKEFVWSKLPKGERNWLKDALGRGRSEEEAFAEFYALWDEYRSGQRGRT